MYYIIHIFYGLILAAAILGYALLWKAKTKLPICFFPITAISGMTVCVYIFGLLGFLKIGCVVVTLGGFLCLWRYSSWHNIKSIFCDWSIWFYIFATIWLFFITRHSGLSHIDDYNHWYRICKAMNYDNTYPITPDIRFYTYVPGTATWIYLLTRFIGFNVSNCFFAQGILNISCLLSFFSVFNNKNNEKYKYLVLFNICLASILLCAIDISTYALLVDTVVAFVPLAALVIVLSEPNIKELTIPLCLLLSFAAIIKNSCLFFVFVTIIIVGFKYNLKKHWFKYIVLCLCVPILIYEAYFVRSSFYYAGMTEASQNISISRFVSLMHEKGYDTILSICKKFFLQITDIGNDTGVTICFFWFIVFLIIYFCAKSLQTFDSSKQRKEYSKLNNFSRTIGYSMVFGVAILLTYSILLLCTYVFSMTTSEANKLACFYRYFGTIVIYLLGGGIYTLLKEFTIFQKNKYNLLILCFTLCYSILFYNFGYIFGYKHYKPVESYNDYGYKLLYENIEENTHYTDNSYLVLWNVNDFNAAPPRNNGQLRNMAITWLRSTNIRVISNEDIAKGLDEKVLQDLINYDYLVTLSDMSEQVEALKDYLPVQDYKVGICPISGGV